MPETQPEVERILAIRRLHVIISEQRRQLIELHQKYHIYVPVSTNTTIPDEIIEFREQMEESYRQLELLRTGGEIVEPKKFVRKCPTEECKGFMNEDWFCGLCDRYFCEKCNEQLCDAHVCDPDAVKTMELLKKDTKGCPKCGTMIHKLSGCFSPETEILMYDGTIKKAKDIVINDKLIGDDGESRTVLKLTNGEDDMYIIKQNKGENYIVNSEHTLVLYYAGNGSIKYYTSINKYKFLWFDKTFKSKNFDTKCEAEAFKKTRLNLDKCINIKIKDYLELKDSRKKTLKGVKLQTSVGWTKKDIHIDPYILGAWLGDGYSNGKEYATNDPELLEYWKTWAKTNNAEVIKTTNKYRYYIKHIHNKHNKCSYKNPLKEQLEKYNLINNKHIPDDYIFNSKDIRLSVLAGIIDTDGSVANNGRRISIITTIEKMSNNIVLLAKSLGFSVNVSTRYRQNENTFDKAVFKNYKNQFCINISGYNLHEIPTILKRKKCKKQLGGVNLTVTSIEVEKIKRGEYYGWAVDGNSRFLLKDFTVTKNCSQMWCPDCHTAFDWRTGHIETGRIHNPHYMEFKRGRISTREHGDIPCGGVPTFRELREAGVPDDVMRFAMVIYYVDRDLVYRYGDIYDGDNQYLRVAYMMNELQEADMRKELQRRDKQRERHRDINNIFRMLTDTGGDLLRQYMIDPDRKDELLDIGLKLIDYGNTVLDTIRKRYNCVLPKNINVY